ncbi:bicaudal-D-related protein 2-like [Melanotaenia boesemani]|uniref:bicaudal-D-related protein 2-like n=1 Tax=Melanotaenia boesemani TaxID=1250792 RepID=UPI001C03FCA8|nr:bicaudal-D-related protein 2-like [Melanotaenia boesemani]XP_041864010.1 bicaudal-D-related protein 2-like [Melanotaenia boesemani]
MDYSQPFSVLNERLKPQCAASELLYSSLTRLEEPDSLRSKPTSYRPTVLLTEPAPEISITEQEETSAEQDGLSFDETEGNCADFLGNDFHDSYLISDLNLKDEDEDELVNNDNGATQTEEEKSLGEVASDEKRDSPKSDAVAGVGRSSFQRCFMDGTLPDLIKTGRVLSRRRTLGHVSDTLKEVRREVELSRRRSIKLKLQVDKLQENRDGPGWSHHREKVTEEVLSILRLLHPLTDPGSSQPEPSAGENCLDDTLAQLQNVARKLAISHTKQDFKSVKNRAEDSAILQQALRDRDEAIEKKKAMEVEVLRSKTEMMALNNQLLEAAQKRLELSLELEAWKEDFQQILQQQLLSQQQAEQAQRKSSGFGLLRRNNKPPIQRPANFPLPAPTPPTTNSSQIFMNKSAGSVTPTPTPPSSSSSSSRMSPSSIGTRTWRDKLKKRKSIRSEDQDAAEREMWSRGDGGFQVVSLD